jgi:hypothetical protein
MTLSHTQHLLGRDQVFISRCKVQMLDVADNVLIEQNIPHHAQRANYARQVVLNPDGTATMAAQYLARTTNVTAAGIDMTDQGPVANVSDAGLLSQINAAWNILAGIDEGTGTEPVGTATAAMPGVFPI